MKHINSACFRNEPFYRTIEDARLEYRIYKYTRIVANLILVVRLTKFNV
jgi:hypothetical protein